MRTAEKELLIRVRTDIQNALRDLDQLSDGVGKTGTQSQRASRQVRGLGTSYNFLRKAVVAYLSVRSLQQVLQLADAYKVLQTRIKTATKDTGDHEKVSRQLFETTQNNGVALETTVSLFQNLARSAPELGATNDQMITLTNSVQQLGVIGGTSTVNLNAGLLQFSQAMSGGILRAEEFNSLLENVPELAKRIATGMGLTTGELRNAVLEGKVLSKDVFDALLKQAPEIAEEFEAIPLSIDRASTRLGTSVAKFIGQLDEASGITASIADGLSDASETLDSANAKEFLEVLQDIAIIAGSLAAGRILGPLIQSIGVSALLAARSIGSMNLQLTALQLRSLAAVASIRVLRTALALLGGPAGIAISVASALVLYSATSDDATASTEALWRETDVLLGKMEALRALDLEAAIDKHVSSIDRLKSRIEFFKEASPRYGFKQGDVDNATSEIKRHEEALVELRAKLETVGQQKTKNKGTTKGLSDEEKKLREKIEETVKSLELQARILGFTAREAALYKLQLQGANQEQLRRADIALRAVENEKARQQALKEETAALKKQREEEKNRNQTLLEAAESVRQLIDPSRIYKLQLEQLTVLLNKGKISTEEYAAAQIILKEQIEEANKSLDETSKFAEKAAENIQTALGDEINSVLNGNFEDIGDSFTRMINRMVAEALAADLAKALLGSYGKDGNTEIGGIFGTIIKSFSYAQGGHVSGPGTSTSDSIPARLSDGEYVVRASAVRQYGVAFLDALNNNRLPASTGIQRIQAPRTHFADGGLVQAGRNQGGINVNMTVVTPDANSFRQSEGQIGLDAARKINRAMRRNG